MMHYLIYSRNYKTYREEVRPYIGKLIKISGENNISNCLPMGTITRIDIAPNYEHTLENLMYVKDITGHGFLIVNIKEFLSKYGVNLKLNKHPKWF